MEIETIENDSMTGTHFISRTHSLAKIPFSNLFCQVWKETLEHVLKHPAVSQTNNSAKRGRETCLNRFIPLEGP